MKKRYATSLKQLANGKNVFKILAIDHVNGLRKQLNALKTNAEVTIEEVVEIKSMVINALKNDLTGILIDKVTYQRTPAEIYGSCGVLIKLDDGWTEAPWNSRERLTQLAEGIDFQMLKARGVVGMKLMLYYRHDLSAETKRHQEDLTRRIAELCHKHELLFCLEPWWYTSKEDEDDTSEGKPLVAQRRPRMVIEPLRELGKPEYGVNLFKLEFPIDSNFYIFNFEPERATSIIPLYDRDDVVQMCKEISTLISVPWVIMSSGVTARQFSEYLEIAAHSDVSGYICGQAIWQEGVRQFPDRENMQKVLETTCRNNLTHINQTADKIV